MSGESGYKILAGAINPFNKNPNLTDLQRNILTNLIIAWILDGLAHDKIYSVPNFEIDKLVNVFIENNKNNLSDPQKQQIKDVFYYQENGKNIPIQITDAKAKVIIDANFQDLSNVLNIPFCEVSETSLVKRGTQIVSLSINQVSPHLCVLTGEEQKYKNAIQELKRILTGDEKKVLYTQILLQAHGMNFLRIMNYVKSCILQMLLVFMEIQQLPPILKVMLKQQVQV